MPEVTIRGGALRVLRTLLCACVLIVAISACDAEAPAATAVPATQAPTAVLPTVTPTPVPPTASPTATATQTPLPPTLTPTATASVTPTAIPPTATVTRTPAPTPRFTVPAGRSGLLMRNFADRAASVKVGARAYSVPARGAAGPGELFVALEPGTYGYSADVPATGRSGEIVLVADRAYVLLLTP